jgi:type IV pilus assembly protein PilB
VVKKDKRLGDILVRKGLISAGELKEAIGEQAKSKEFLGAVLLRLNLIRPDELLQALSEQFDMPVVSLKNRYFEWDFVKGFSPELIFDHKCFPLKREGSKVVMAIANPLDYWAIKRAEEETGGLELKLLLASDDDIREAITRYKEYLKGNIDNLFK